MNDTTITNLKSRAEKLQDRPKANTNLDKEPEPDKLACGLTPEAIKVFKLAKEQQAEQRRVE